MEFAFVESIAGLISTALALLNELAGSLIEGLSGFKTQLQELPSKYPRLFEVLTLPNVFGALSASIAAWKWWETRDAQAYSRFQKIIERELKTLDEARGDVLDLVKRPGPGRAVRVPLFGEPEVLATLRQRNWVPKLSVRPRSVATIRRLERKGVERLNDYIEAFRRQQHFACKQKAAATLIQGAVAAAYAGRANDIADKQRNDAQALDYYQKVLSIPGHESDPDARELIALQQYKIEGAKPALRGSLIEFVQALEREPGSERRDLQLAHVKKLLARVHLELGSPGLAANCLRSTQQPINGAAITQGSIELLQKYPALADRDRLELARAFRLYGEARIITAPVQSRQDIGHAISLFSSLLEQIDARRPGLFRWMRERRFAGHRISEFRTIVSQEREEARQYQASLN